MSRALEQFTPATRSWFEAAFAAPTEVQERGWRTVAGGAHTLMTAPTGSGKTLAAFLWCLDRLAAEAVPPARERCRVLYLSPLKALAVDVERNLRAPLAGIQRQAERLGLGVPDLTVGIRTGDTPPEQRRQMERHPPDILITTPESLFLLLTSAARAVLAGVRWVILDEIHAVAATKRGAHLALSLERLGELTDTEPQRIGLSATQRPLDLIGRFLGGGRPVEIVDAARRKSLAITIEVPVDDMSDLQVGAPPPQLPSGNAAGLGDGPPPPRRSIWPAIYPRLLELVLEHRSTIVFVNARRTAERLAARLNELAVEGGHLAPDEPELVQAHHGSLAREQRTEIEDRLKSGRLRAIVATSSLELGIDMGAVDLVVQVESPPSVAAGIQRIGRAGHAVGETSQGTIFPKFRGDLLEAAVVVERMHAGEIEHTTIPRNPIDVLAQQVVAAVAMDEWAVADLHRLVTRALPFADLSRRSLETVLDMLAGRYPSDEFRDLRPRLVWDRTTDTLRARAGAQRLAVQNAGTIPDRGLYTVNLLSDGRRVGELDEEMVFETHPGETFVLGATTWRVADITQSQVLVEPAPGEPGKVAFWKGDGISRPSELGRAVGQVTRELRAMPRDDAVARLRERSGCDERAARNLMQYLDDQAAATGSVPDDRTVVVERFRDEVGDWRVCLLTPIGGRVLAPWALALQARLRERFGIEAQTLSTDDGLAIHLPDADRPLDPADLLIEPEEIEDLVAAQLPGSALFAGRFRENAARALLLPRRRPGQRTPLWQQRQRSSSLLQVAGRHPDFPILAETYRECLADVFDLPALKDLLEGIRSREIHVVVVDTERASPYSGSLLFEYVGQFLYDGDAPLAERRAQALLLDRELLADLLGSEDLRELLSPEVMAALELELQGLLRERWPRDPDEAHDLLARLGDLSSQELAARGVSPEWIEDLRRARRVISIRLAGCERWIVAEDAARYRDGLGVAIPPGLPEAFLEPGPDPLVQLVRRFARTHVPFSAQDLASRWGVATRTAAGWLDGMQRVGALVAGEFGTGGAREYCHPEVLQVLRRRSLAALRREAEAVPQAALARFLRDWQGVGSSERSPDRMLSVVRSLQGLPLPASVVERDVLAERVAGYSPALLDQLLGAGEVVWIGRGSLGPGDGRVALYERADVERLLPEPGDPAQGRLQDQVREHLRSRGASFFRELLQAVRAPEDELLDALWDLVWAGEVTNDTFGPLRVATAPRRRASPRPIRASPVSPRAAGRWSLVAALGGDGARPTEVALARATTLLERYGILTREAVLAEGLPGGFASLYPVLRAMEESGRIRRGYFVEGLGGSQFALPGAIERLRAHREPEDQVTAVAATDPANPFGAVLPWPAGGAGDGAGPPPRLARVAGAYVVLQDGDLRLYLDRGGRTLWTRGEVTPRQVTELRRVATRAGKVEVQRIDGEPPHASRLEPVLREAGFGTTPRGLVAWAPSAGR